MQGDCLDQRPNSTHRQFVPQFGFIMFDLATTRPQRQRRGGILPVTYKSSPAWSRAVSTRRRFSRTNIPSNGLEVLESRVLLSGITAPTMASVVDLGTSTIADYGFRVPHFAAFSPASGETFILIESAQFTESLTLGPGPEQEFLIVGDDQTVQGPFAIDQADVHVSFLSTRNGEPIAAGTGRLDDGDARQVLVDLRSGEVTGLAHPRGELESFDSDVFNFDYPLVAGSDLGTLYVTDASTGESVRLEFIEFSEGGTFGDILTVNAEAGLVGGTESASRPKNVVAWDARTGEQLTQFSSPEFLTPDSGSALVSVNSQLQQFTGIFGANADRPAVAGIEFMTSDFDDGLVGLDLLLSVEVTDYVGFFSVETGELLQGQFFPGQDALTVEVGDNLLTTYTAVVGNPTYNPFSGDVPETELRVNIWDGTSFVDQPLADVLADFGITTDFTDYEVVSLDSTPDANGDIRISMLLSDRTLTGAFSAAITRGTQLVSLTYPLAVDPPDTTDGSQGGEERTLLTGVNVVDGLFADLGQTHIQETTGLLMRSPVIFDPTREEWIVLSNPSGALDDFAVTRIDSTGSIGSVEPIARRIFTAQLNNINGDIFVVATGILDGEGKALLIDINSGTVEGIDHPRDDVNHSVNGAVDGSLIVVRNGDPEFLVNLSSGATVELENRDTTGNQLTLALVVNEETTHVVGVQDVVAKNFVAWNVTTGLQTTQFVAPSVTTLTDSAFALLDDIIQRPTGLSALEGEVVGLQFAQSSFDLLTFEAIAIQHTGFFRTSDGSLIASFPGFNGLTAEVDNGLLTIFTSVVGDPIISSLNPTQVTELRINFFQDGQIQWELPLDDFILLEAGLTTTLTADHQIVGIDSVERADGTTMLSALFTDADDNTVLVGLTFEEQTVVEEPPTSNGNGEPGSGNGGEESGTGGEESGTGGSGTGGETGAESGDTPVGTTNDDLVNVGNSFPIVITTTLTSSGSSSASIAFGQTLQTSSVIDTVLIVPSQTGQFRPLLDNPITLVEPLSTPQKAAQVAKALATVSKFVPAPGELSEEELISELNALVEMGLLDADLVDQLVEHFRMQPQQKPDAESSDNQTGQPEPEESDKRTAADIDADSRSEALDLAEQVDLAINSVADFLFGTAANPAVAAN